MYVFTSAFFFIFFFWFFNPQKFVPDSERQQTATEVRAALERNRADLHKKLADTARSEKQRKRAQDELQRVEADLAFLARDTTHLDSLHYIRQRQLLTDGEELEASTVAQYDSLQLALPEEKRDNWLERKVALKKIEVRNKYGSNTSSYLLHAFNKFLHYFPQIMFLSLPIFALILSLLYIRRQQFYYADHGIFTVHLYCAMFIFIFLQMIMSWLEDVPYMGWISLVETLLLLYAVWYIYRAMRTFYGQGRKKTFVKFVLLMMLCSFVMSFIFLVYFVVSLFTV